MRNGVSFCKFCENKFLRFDVGAFLLGDVSIKSNDASIDGRTRTRKELKINSKQITLIDRWSMEFFFIRLMVANFCSVSFDRFLFLWETEDYLQNLQKQIALGYFYVCSLHCYLQKFSNGTDKETSLNNQELF